MLKTGERKEPGVAKIFIPVGYHLIVKPEKAEEKTKGGIFVPESVREAQQKAAVVGQIMDIGPDCMFNKNGDSLNKCDKIVFARYGGMELPDLNDDGEHLRALNDEDVIARVIEK